MAPPPKRLLAAASLMACAPGLGAVLGPAVPRTAPVQSSGASAQAGPTQALGLPTSHVRWFGFVGVECGFDDPLDGVVLTDYTAEVAAFTNLAHLCPFAVDEDLSPRLDALEAQGLRALLSVEGLFFDSVDDPTLASGYRLQLNPAHEQLWSLFLEQNAGQLTQRQVAAIYVCDEPAWHALPPADLARVCDLIASTLPALPTLVVEAPLSLATPSVPPSLDWVGFDRYGVLDPGSDATYLAELDLLESLLTRQDQRLVLVPDTQWLPAYATLGLAPADMGFVAANYLSLALTRPRVVGLISYLWPSGLDDPAQLGARELPPAAQAVLQTIGKFITRK